MALTYSHELNAAFNLPPFALPSVLGPLFSSKGLEKEPVALVVFICGHCPYVLSIEHRLILLGAELKNLNVPMVGICSNDPSDHPDDTAESLRKKYVEKKYSFPYLIDESQNVAKAFGAVCTPDFFLFKRGILAYRGRLDDSWRDEFKVKRQELLEAIHCLLKDQPITNPVSPSMGCSIKWKTP